MKLALFLLALLLIALPLLASCVGPKPVSCVHQSELNKAMVKTLAKEEGYLDKKFGKLKPGQIAVEWIEIDGETMAVVREGK